MDQKHFKDRTYAAQFLLPLVGVSKDIIMASNYINTYLYVEGISKEEHMLHIVYEDIDVEDFMHALLKLSDQTLEYSTHVFGDVVVISVPIAEEVYIKFKEGNYKGFSNEVKQKILSFWDASIESRLYTVLYPKQYFAEAYGITKEVGNIWPKPTISSETFNPKDYVQEGTKEQV